MQKVFILDAQGGYAGEFVVQDECVVEFGDFLAAVPPQGLEDRQSIFLGEYRATALHGDRMSLVAITKGPIQPEEIAWGRAAFTAAEGHLGGEGGASPAAGPDKAILENLAQALEKREAQITEREKALEEKAAVASNDLQAIERAKDAELKELRTRLSDLETQRDRMREEMARIAQAPADASAAAERKQLEKDRKMLQRRALELLDREERIREREFALADEHKKIEESRKEVDGLLAKIEAAKRAAPEFDVEAARREVDMRVKILQQKALDLLDREEKLRRREAELQGVAAPMGAPENPEPGR
jgi:hypothetical protein